jgi:hypothetical protein
VIGIEKFFILPIKQSGRTNEFLKDLFPERLKAYQEIDRVITECGINCLDPKRLGPDSIKIILKNARQRFEAVGFEILLDAERHVAATLFELSPLIAEVTKIDGDLERENLFRDVLERLKAKNRKLVKLLREKSGVDIIDQEFAKAIKTRK